MTSAVSQVSDEMRISLAVCTGRCVDRRRENKEKGEEDAKNDGRKKKRNNGQDEKKSTTVWKDHKERVDVE